MIFSKSSTYSRIGRGDAMLLGLNIFKAKMKNSYHFAKNNLAQFHSTHIVVQGSPLLARIFAWKRKHEYITDNFNLQDLFHSTVNWFQTNGITQKLVDNHLNAEPYIPLPKQNKNKPLELVQLIMLWIIYISGLAIGLFVFIGELVAGCFAKHLNQKQAGGTNRQDQALKPSRESQGGTLITVLDWI